MTLAIQPPPFGVYAPVVTFFNEDETIDFASISQHVKRLLLAGVKGLVIHGSNGEATHLLSDERTEVIRQVKNMIQEHQRDAVIIAGVASGIDLDSDLIIDLANATSNIVGVKLTCGNLGKLQRVSASISAERFVPFSGKADFLLPGLVVGSNGVISALANVVPKVHVELIRLYKSGDLEKAQGIQKQLALADWALLKFGISGVKTACCKWFGYGSGRVRSPLQTVDTNTLDASPLDALQAVVDLEKSLQTSLSSVGS
ncbi:hypothetical protein QQX98_011680 [Neonectria punicea]|uniref:Dihydrodipicolinate synthetase n=1 Tax=Neonectria punicea TaxID=979145 RepID=A0ABR1GLG2_9HYPO